MKKILIISGLLPLLAHANFMALSGEQERRLSSPPRAEDVDAVIVSTDEQDEQDPDKAEQILQEIVRFGLEETDYLLEVKERQLYEQGIRLKKSEPAHFMAVFNKQKKKSKELSRVAYASLHASSLLARQFQLTRSQVVYGLERVELRSTELARQCISTPTRPSQECAQFCRREEQLRFRTADGTCNNLRQTTWGSSFTPFLRFLPPVYSDTIGNTGEFRTPVRRRRNNRVLPSPRRISAAVHRDSLADMKRFSLMVMQWGQFLDHDITSTPMTRGFNNSLIKCCTEDGRPLPEDLRHPDCRPIDIPTDDPFYSQFNVTCMEFVRTSPAAKQDCSLGPRDQLNQITSFIDASNVYGSTEEESNDIRLFSEGKLRYTDLHIRKSLLPPLDNEVAEEECRVSTPYLHCFHAGDVRVNEQPGLTTLHTLWLREHNRLAQLLQRINPGWNDERVFQETRKIVGAMHQHITFNEWLPVILGEKVLDIFELNLYAGGYYEGYNDTVNPSVANAFGAAAFRFGHSLVKSSLSRCNKEFREVPFFVKLHKELNNPTNLHNFGSVDRLILGLCSKAVNRRDEFITTELTNHLFQNPRTPYGMDLAAINIQRGRDHGLPPYNIWREQCGLKRFPNFNQMTEVMDARTVEVLRDQYDHVDDIDLFTGGLAEHPVFRGMVGPTFSCIIGQQFLNLRKGDRFWYENGPDANPGAFTEEQLLEIRKTSLARVICDNLDDIRSIQPYAFLMIDEYSNQRVRCTGRTSSILTLDITKWRDRSASSGSDDSFNSIQDEAFGSSFSQLSQLSQLNQLNAGASSQLSPLLNRPPLSYSATSLKVTPPLNPIAQVYTSTQELPGRPDFNVWREHHQLVQQARQKQEEAKTYGPMHEYDDEELLSRQSSGNAGTPDDDVQQEPLKSPLEYMMSHKLPYFKESDPSTAEVPTRLTPDHYFKFYEKYEAEGDAIADIDLSEVILAKSGRGADFDSESMSLGDRVTRQELFAALPTKKQD